MKRILERRQCLPVGLDAAWTFFSDPRNLSRITPPELGFEMLGVPPRMQQGVVLDYRIRVAGLRLRWRSRIDLWQPRVAFVDVQERGPYRSWRHLHRFRADGDRTWVEDRVEYELPFAPLGELAHAWIVGPQLERIFEFRSLAIAGMLGPGVQVGQDPGRSS